MHIMEGVLSWQWCLVWWLVALPCLIYGVYYLTKLLTVDREALPLLRVTGGFIFILSSLKRPSITGSCSHPTGTGLPTTSFGPWITTVVCFKPDILIRLKIFSGEKIERARGEI